MHRVTGLLLGLALVLPACALPEDAPPPDSPLGGDSALRPLFDQVAADYQVPVEILATAIYVDTRLQFRDHDPRVATDAIAEILAARGADLGAPLAAWRPALIALTDDFLTGVSFADQVLAHIGRGWSGRDGAGDTLILSARPVGDANRDDGVGSLTLAAGYPGAIWNPASSTNYTNASRTAADINYVIVHTTQGSYAGCISWFKNADSDVSAHYVVRSSDGEITQMVDDADIAWHDGCFNTNTIGIEHEGWVDQPEVWYTEAMYLESAKMVAWLAATYGIPKDRDHILGHGEAPDCSDHTDPGSGWDWDHYMALVQSGGQPTYGARLVAKNHPEEMESGTTATVWFDFENQCNITWGLDETRLGTAEPQDRSSAFYVDGNWLSPSRATGADHSDYGPGAVGRFSFALRAPEVDQPTTFTESFRLVQEGAAWFGPVVTMTITIVPAGWQDPPPENPEGGDAPGRETLSGEADDGGGFTALHGGCAVGASRSSDGQIVILLVLCAWLVDRRRARRR